MKSDKKNTINTAIIANRAINTMISAAVLPDFFFCFWLGSGDDERDLTAFLYRESGSVRFMILE